MADFENNDVVSLSARMEYDAAHSIVNAWHFILDNGGPLQFSQITLAIQNYLDTIYGNLTDYISDLQLPVSIGVRNETQGTVFGSMSWGSWAGGVNAQDPLPLGVCCLAWARTYVPRVQLRKYFGVFTEQHLATGVWASALRTACDDALVYHIAQQTPDTGITITGVAYNRTLLSVTYGQSVTTTGEPAYQRRRRRGRGS